MSHPRIVDVFVSLRENVDASALILGRAGICGRLAALGASVAPVGLAELSVQCPPTLVATVYEELSAWARSGRRRRVRIRSGGQISTIPEVDQEEPVALPVADIVDTDSGPLRRYPVDGDSFVLVDDTGSDLAVSWAGACTPSGFLRMCAPLAAAEPASQVIIATGGGPVVGPGTHTISQITQRLGERLDDVCDFVRLDTPTICFAFHRMPPDGAGDGPVIVSAVAERRFAESFPLVAELTAREDVARMVTLLAWHEVARNPLPAVLVNLQHPARPLSRRGLAGPNHVVPSQPEVPFVERKAP